MSTDIDRIHTLEKESAVADATLLQQRQNIRENNVVKDYKNTSYNIPELLTLAKQIAEKINLQNLGGKVYELKNDKSLSVGFGYNEAKAVLNDLDPSPLDMVILDMARQLINNGVYDIAEIQTVYKEKSIS